MHHITYDRSADGDMFLTPDRLKVLLRLYEIAIC